MGRGAGVPPESTDPPLNLQYQLNPYNAIWHPEITFIDNLEAPTVCT